MDFDIPLFKFFVWAGQEEAGASAKQGPAGVSPFFGLICIIGHNQAVLQAGSVLS